MLVTVDYLKSLKACVNQVEVFTTTFGESVEVTKESLTRANGAGLNLDWFGAAVFGEVYVEGAASARKVYNEVRVPLLKGYKEAVAPAWEVYAEAILEGEALKTYAFNAYAEKILKSDSLKAYQEARATAWKVYQEATALAWKAYKKEIAPAWKAYQKALIEVILKLSQVTSTP